MSRARIAVVLAFAVVAAGSVAASLPLVTARIALPNDAVEYLAVAWSWVRGSGLVDPVIFSYYVDAAAPPVPAMLVRPPLFSILLAGMMALGVGLVGLSQAHVLWAGAVGASTTLLAARSASLPAAVALGALVSWSSPWQQASARLLTEATAVAMLLGLLALAPRALRSPGAALALAACTLLGWLTRPNLAAFAGLFALAAVVELGPRAALRSKPLWVYLGAFFLLLAALRLVVETATGFPPYAHYGIMIETAAIADLPLYRTRYVGAAAFFAAQPGQVLGFAWENLKETLAYAFLRPDFLFVGWLAAPGLVHAFRRRGEAAFTHKLVALCALGFTAVAVGTSWGFSSRYLLPGFVCAAFTGMVFFDHVAGRVAGHFEGRWAKLVRRGAAPALALVLLSVEALPQIATRLQVVATRSLVTQVRLQRGGAWNARSHALCEHLEPDARVASPNPWNVLYWCGNAGAPLPPDLESQDGLHRYLDEQEPGYLIADADETLELLAASPRLERIASHSGAVVFRARTAPAPPWRSPGPLKQLAPGQRLMAQGHGQPL